MVITVIIYVCRYFNFLTVSSDVDAPGPVSHSLDVSLATKSWHCHWRVVLFFQSLHVSQSRPTLMHTLKKAGVKRIFHYPSNEPRVRQSLDVGLAKTLVQAFVTSRVDYCNAVLAELPRVTTDKLQRVMNSAARIVTDTRKYDSGLSRLMYDELHWLDVTDRIRFKLAVLMYRCLHGTAPPYLVDSCTLTAEVTGRQHLRSATQRKLVVPRYRLNSFGRRRFSVAGPSTWNSLPDSLRDPELSLDTFKRQLKTYIFAKY